ncbi:hypothetical protein M434DRAFT_256142 [Hypoxylon sp. CO27-5]|nr:hypothetical protein M434DRAFT_256142 [Hypoxylon sp. CO27-5]
MGTDKKICVDKLPYLITRGSQIHVYPQTSSSGPARVKHNAQGFKAEEYVHNSYNQYKASAAKAMLRPAGPNPPVSVFQ